MEVLKTPQERFHSLKDFPFAPHFVDIPWQDQNLEMHYLDEGPKDANPILVLHGEPSWSYLYRTMIPILVKGGHRVVAPDLIGFGRSDKPASRDDYSYERHVDWMQLFIRQLDLRDITLVCQDWGGLIGLRMVAFDPDRFLRVVAANTMLPTGEHDPGEAFLKWQNYSQTTDSFNVGKIVGSGCVKELDDEIVAAYDAPFPDESYKAGARVFPALVPTKPDSPGAKENKQAWQKLMQWNKPFLTAFSDSDPITKGGDRVMQKLIPGCLGQKHVTLKGGGHFLQEDCGLELATEINKFIANNPNH